MGKSFTQRQHPHETSAEQSDSEEILLRKRDTAKDSTRNLKDKTQSIQKCVEELDREVDIVMDLVDKKEEKIQRLEKRNRELAKINEQLNSGITKMAPKVSWYDYGVNKSSSSVGLQNGDRYDEPEKVITCYLGDSLDEEKLQGGSSKLHKNTRSIMSMTEIETMPVDEEEEDQTFPAMLEADKLEESSVIRSKPLKYLCNLWDLGKCLLAVVLTFGFCTCLILSCAYYFNHNFIANGIALLFSDHDIAELTELLSPYLTWRNSGLLPF